ncbi:HD domain-containing protein [Bacillus sp. JJ722]|uniref:HD domain-containing protein n=1 Tax=Bacillus sp. JJ722 TaxID=3122973 RepID=UPI002FFEAEAF
MIVKDNIYGEYVVEGVLEELINSAQVQRLKDIHQGGASYLVNDKWNVTRYDHSIGVMLLIKQLGGSIEEQIAGLLHDISHTAFSHVIDFVIENKEENYHEKIYESIIGKSDIPQILSKYGYDYKYILFDVVKWTILEQSAPKLCADRVDYTLRDMYEYGIITLNEVQFFLKNMMIIDGEICLRNIESAEWFTETYYKEVIDFFMNPLNIYGNNLLANILKIALNKKIINLDTFLGTDEEVLLLLRNSDDHEVQSRLKYLHGNVIVVEDSVHYDLHQKSKLRLIDPSILYKNELMKASRKSELVKCMGEKAKLKAEKGMYVKIVSN